jgi:hypothetical protein
MPWPLSQDYNEAIQNPSTCFTDPELKQGEAVCNALGLPQPCSGNFADVYAVQSGSKKWAVKCFTRQIPGLQERYVQISKYLQQVNLPFMVEFTFLEKGIQVRGQSYPVLKMQWVEGFALNAFVRDNLDKPQVLQTLCQIWLRLATRLREANLAHCDLQHGNVLLVPSKAGALGVRLVDYDGMCVPALELLKSIELGHANYQHPQRLREGSYGLQIDRFPHLVIYTALRSLSIGGKALWDKFDNGDNLLFTQKDFAAPGQSPLFHEILRLNDPEVRKLTQVLAQASQKPIEQVPLLDTLVAVLPPSSKVTETMPTAVPAGIPEAAPAFAGGVRKQRIGRRQRGRSWVGLALAGCIAAALVAGGAYIVRNELPLQPEGSAAVVQVVNTRKPATTATLPETKPLVPSPTEPKVKPKTELETDKPKNSRAVDLLKLIDPKNDAVRGKWVNENGALLSPNEDWARLSVPFDLPHEYDLHIAVERRSGTDAFTVGLVGEGVRGYVAIDRIGENLIHVKPGAAGTALFRAGASLPLNKRRTFDFAVRKRSLRVLLDGQLFLEFEGDFSQFQPIPGWEVQNRRSIVLAAWQSQFLFSEIKLLQPGVR